MKAVILSYHSHNIFGTGYQNNDHVAFAQDIETITGAGGEIISLMSLVSRLISCKAGEHWDNGGRVCVALTFDDGPIFDFKDFVHPDHGHQRSFYNHMLDFRAMHGDKVQPGLSATSFVIASPSGRQAMARSPECGYTFLDEEWLGDGWWESAARTGIISIGNHSWDHVHPAIPSIALSSGVRGDFSRVASYADADAQIRRASSFISNRTKGLAVPLFAFPYGHYSDYLVNRYFSGHREEHGMIAAFSTGGKSISVDDSLWCLPRFICGHHWKSPEELVRILNG